MVSLSHEDTGAPRESLSGPPTPQPEPLASDKTCICCSRCLVCGLCYGSRAGRAPPESLHRAPRSGSQKTVTTERPLGMWDSHWGGCSDSGPW